MEQADKIHGQADKPGELHRCSVSPNISLCSDGKMRWVHELNLYKNPVILFLILKIMLFIFFGLFLFVVLLEIPDMEDVLNTAAGFAPVMALVFAAVGFLSAVSYFIWALIIGGKYCVLFEMDHKGINHIQIDKQFKKAQVLGFVTTLVGAVTANPTVAGAGLAAGNKQSLYSKFKAVRRIKVYRRSNIIKLNGAFIHNQIYTSPEDFDFVLDYISSHCENAVIKGIKNTANK